ncbi:hypothetical protein F4808DRAFT_48402 [Astrocystis sublimbata]|nr:hypothetical protein F4808DRAFT_48402 [Astrocystis sublimbata]
MRFSLAVFGTLATLAMATPASLETSNRLMARAPLCDCALTQSCGCPTGEWCVCSASQAGGAPCTKSSSCGCPYGVWGNCQVL